MAVPPVLLEVLNLEAGSQVTVGIERGQLVVERKTRRRYTLAELLKQCDPKARRSSEEKLWVANKPVGRELL